MTIYNPTREERAFLYQEAQDLEPLMKDLGSLSVMVEQISPEQVAANEGKKAKSRYRVTFVVAPESVGMKVQATDNNLFEAAIAAKDEALRQLNAIVNAMPRQWNLDLSDGKIPPQFLH